MAADLETRNSDTAAHGPSGAPLDPSRSETVEREVVDVVRGLTLALHPRRRESLTVTVDSTLEGDLGIDSLGRAELLYRLERACRVHLPEDLLGRAETVRDLLCAVRRAGGESGPVVSERAAPIAAPREQALPTDAATLIEVLERHVFVHGGRTHLLLPESGAETRTISYRSLSQRARRVAGGLRRSGVEPGDRVAILLPTGEEFFYAFFGALYAGAVPVPLYPPVRMSRIEEHLRRQAGILKNAGASALVTVPEGQKLAALLMPQIPTLRTVATATSLRAGEAVGAPTPHGRDLAMLQYTSGSTGDPKGVMLTHDNLLANIRAMGEAMNVDGNDVFVSWLPLYHDMGLIGAWLGSLYFGVPAVIMSPIQFIMRPESWLWAIHRHRGTLSAAPNFAFEHCLQNIEDDMIEGLDLSSLRVVVDGAEPVSAQTLRRFVDRFADCGLRPEAIAPSYGLAECTVGLTCSPPGRGPLIDRIERAALTRRGEAAPASATDANAVEMVACGRPLPGHQVRIVDAAGREAPERTVGRLQFRGPSATSGYFDNPQQTERLFDGEWLESGDLAYIAGGDVFITGRSKEVVIRAGRNIYPHELEEAIGDIAGIRKGCVAVFGSTDPASGTERIVVVAETEETDPDRREQQRREIGEATAELLETPPDDIVLGGADTVPKTPSGKIQRTAARELYEAGRLGDRQRALWLQLLRLKLAGQASRVRRMLRSLTATLYAGYWWFVLVVLAAACWAFVVTLPTRRLRWSVIHRCAMLHLSLTAMRPEIHGLENLTKSGCVLVANHSSYLDGLVLAAALPGELVFIAKQELAPQFVAGTFLRRLDAIFVNRRDPEAGVEETKAVGKRALAQRRLVFFPEGTFTRAPGLLPFRMGAFVVAAQAAVPVIPVAIRGTRSIMRSGQWFPNRGRIAVDIGEPLSPVDADFAAAVKLRDGARRFILDRCGEPDLSEERMARMP